MGIENRDYMKRPSGDSAGPSSAEGKLEAFFSNFLARYPRFFLYSGVALALLFVAVLIATKFSRKSP